MFLPFLALSAISTALVKLGALSVQVSMLGIALKAALALAVFLAVLLFFGKDKP